MMDRHGYDEVLIGDAKRYVEYMRAHLSGTSLPPKPAFEDIDEHQRRVAALGPPVISQLSEALRWTVIRGSNLPRDEHHWSFAGTPRTHLAISFVHVTVDLVQYYQEILSLVCNHELDSCKGRRAIRDLYRRYDLRTMCSPPPPPSLGGSSAPPNEQWFPNAFNPLYGVRQTPRTANRKGGV